MIEEIAPKEAQRRIGEEGWIYLDVRSQAEYGEGHAPGAYNIPLLDHDPNTGVMAPNQGFVAQVTKAFGPETKVVCGCASGGRSMQAAQLLAREGYGQVANLAGGFLGKRDMIGQTVAPGWVGEGLPQELAAQAGRSFGELK